MFFERGNKDKQEKAKYKATYKSLHSGNTRTFASVNPVETLTHFLQKNDNVWEMYVLVSITPIDETESLR